MINRVCFAETDRTPSEGSFRSTFYDTRRTESAWIFFQKKTRRPIATPGATLHLTSSPPPTSSSSSSSSSRSIKRWQTCDEIEHKQVLKVSWHKVEQPPCTDQSIVFATWRQCAPSLIYGSLGPQEFACKRHLDRFSRFCRANRCRSRQCTSVPPAPRDSLFYKLTHSSRSLDCFAPGWAGKSEFLGFSFYVL